MILGSKAELAGRVKLQISGGARGTIDYPWQDNMILDQGFVQLITGTSRSEGSLITYFSVGGSSQPVAPTDTGLIAPIAQVALGTGFTHGWDGVGGFGWSRSVKSFARGIAAGNISEMAAGWGDNNVTAAARALVRDEHGNPTTITVLGDEVLTLTWELRRWWSTPESHNVEYLVDGDPQTTTVNYIPLSVLGKSNGELGSGGITPIQSSLISSTGGVFVGEFSIIYTEEVGNPQVASVSTEGVYPTGGQYVAGVLFPHNPAYATFDPPIAKTNEFILEIRHRISLTRREP